MAADVSSLVRVLSGYKDDRAVGNEPAGGKSTALITRDLLGGGGGGSTKDDSQELDLDMEVPCGWEKRLDLKSGKVYLQRCNSSNHKYQSNQTVPSFQDLNFPPSPSKLTLNLFDETSLELKLVSSSISRSYQNVCTLDRVKSALERADKAPVRKRPSFLWKGPVSPSCSSSSSSVRDVQEEENEERLESSSPVAAGCPGCLSYVLITKNNPRCPRCNTAVPVPLVKKARIDLNMSIYDTI